MLKLSFRLRNNMEYVNMSGKLNINFLNLYFFVPNDINTVKVPERHN